MIGHEIGNFVVVQKIGHGGMGEVYLAEQKSIKTKVAIKALLPHVSANRDHIQRFFNEAIAVSKIRHAGIAKIFDVGFTSNGQAYLVMEFLEGETVASRIHRMGRMPLSQLAEVGRQISNVLEATHQAGITHRDLKPENIFLVPDAEMESGERVKILDFGIAKLGAGSSMTNTSVGSMGTPGYMAPEQWHNSKAVDWRADAYSLGCLTFEMACGRPPFPAESIAEACTKHLTQMPEPLRQLVPSLPEKLELLVGALLEKDPSRRPATMKEVTKTFARLIETSGLSATLAAPERVSSLPPPPPPMTPPLPRIEPTMPVVPKVAPRTEQPTPVPATTTLGGASMAFESKPRSSIPFVLGLVAVVGVIAAAIFGVLFLSNRHTNQAEATLASGSASAPTIPPSPQPAITPIDVDAGTVAMTAAVPAEAAVPPDAGAVHPHHDQVAQRPLPAPKAAIANEEPACPPTDETCDEVSCVLNNYEGPCCCKFKKGHGPSRQSASEASGLPESLDRDMISSGIANAKARIQACGDKSPAKGKVKVHVAVSPDGSVSSVSVETTPDPALGACVAAQIQKAKFGKTQNGGLFSYPFVF